MCQNQFTEQAGFTEAEGRTISNRHLPATVFMAFQSPHHSCYHSHGRCRFHYSSGGHECRSSQPQRYVLGLAFCFSRLDSCFLGLFRPVPGLPGCLFIASSSNHFIYMLVLGLVFVSCSICRTTIILSFEWQGTLGYF